MGICNNNIISTQIIYDCVKICDSVNPKPIVEYDFDLDNFEINVNIISSSGVIEYKWQLITDGFEIYNSGYGLANEMVPLGTNGSTYQRLRFGNNYQGLKNVLDDIAPYYKGIEIEFVLTVREVNGKEGDPFSSLLLVL